MAVSKAAAQIAAAAFDQLGTPFRLHGRMPNIGLDCVGLVHFAAAMAGYKRPCPADYSLRGDRQGDIVDFFDDPRFAKLNQTADFQIGDIVLVRCAPRQVHLLIYANNGWVHAHAGLGRVVWTAAALEWPIIALWRYQGD